jgi:hypothetical protein
MKKGRAHCFVVTLMRGGYKHYLTRVDVNELEGSPLPCFVGRFSIDLMDAQKFTNELDAHYFADRFKGAQVEIIKTSEVLKSDRK